MSDENEANNPYQPPTLSDETLAKKGGDAPKAKPHPANWLIPWLGYGYVPLVIGLIFNADIDNFDRYYTFINSAFALLFLLPVYGLVILGLTAQRTLRKTNSVGLTLFQILSVVLPILWFFFVLSFNGSPA
ncbi:MAG: hypothetical protein ACON32_03785 [Pirellulaceae bacterium]